MGILFEVLRIMFAVVQCTGGYSGGGQCWNDKYDKYNNNKAF